MTRLFFARSDLPGRLAVATCPAGGRGLPADLQEWCGEGIQLVVSLLGANEAEELGVGDEAGLCRQVGLDFISVPTMDHGVPTSTGAFDAAVALALDRLVGGEGVVAHCLAGIGRSPMFAACVLVRSGLDANEACKVLSAARGIRVPEMEEQKRWVEAYQDRHDATRQPG